MARLWAPKIQAIQNALAAAIQAQRDLVAADLPTPLQGDDFQVAAARDRDTRDLLPNGCRVLPPENSSLDAEVTDGFEGVLQFPVALRTKTLDSEAALLALTELVGLVFDAVSADPTLGDLTGGTASPGLLLGPIDVAGGEAVQEVVVRFHVRLQGA